MSHEGGEAGTSPDQVRLTNMTSDQAVAIVEMLRESMSGELYAMDARIDVMIDMRHHGETPENRLALARAIKVERGLSRGTRSARGWRYCNKQIGRGRNFSTQASV